MAEELPSWLDEMFLATVLQGGEDVEPRVTVVQFSAKPAVAAGNNYTSHLYRVHVEYRVGESDQQSASLIVKAPITKGAISQMSEKTDFFLREPIVYTELLPKMKEKINIEFGPNSLYCPISNGLVLQDMKDEGYVMCDKHKQLDYPHCKHALILLAKFHATSVACYHENPTLINTVGEEIFYVYGGPMEKEFKPWLDVVFTTISEITLKHGLKEFSDILLSRRDQIWKRVSKVCKPKEKGLNILNHGDLWTNNILFKHNADGEVISVKFIDFQIARYTSPAVDLLYFIWTSANEDVREHRLPELYDTYLQTLNLTLDQLGCEERMTLEELNTDLKSSSDFVLVIMCSLLPFMVCDPCDVVDMETVDFKDFENGSPDKKFLQVFNGEIFKSLLPKLAKQFQAYYLQET